MAVGIDDLEIISHDFTPFLPVGALRRRPLDLLVD
jgi:hypothetical protein